jgi:lipopolysaccharide transport protein LptA/LPS export ABC transporter protein LptC
MPIKPRRGNVTWLRVLLLILLIGTVGGVFGLLYFGRAGQTKKKKPADDDAMNAEKGTTLIGQDFDYTYTQGNRPVFRIRGDSIQADKEGTLYLEKVGVIIYDQKARPFEVESRQATFKRATNEGQFRGKVHLKGPGDLELRTDALDLLDQGHTVITERPASINFAKTYLAWGKQLQVHMNEQLFLLEGETSITNVDDKAPDLSLKADRLVYHRDQRQIQAEGDVELVRDKDRLKTDSITTYLDADEKSALSIRALGHVSGEAHPKSKDPGNAIVRFKGDDLTLVMDPEAKKAGQEVRTVTLVGKPPMPGQKPGRRDDKAELQTIGAGVTRTLLASRVEGHMVDGVLASANGFGGVDLRETGAGGALLRHAAGQRAQAGFKPDGQVSALSLEDTVTYKDPQIEVSGDRGQMNFEAGLGEFFGRPVHAHSERGQFTGPHLLYERATGVLHGEDGVQALLEPQNSGALGDSPLEQGEGPVHVDAKEAFLRDKPRSFLFRGDVRAWRGESLLTAPAVRGDQTAPGAGETQGEDRLTATGGVKTLYIPRPQETGTAGGGAGGGKDPGTPQKPIEVTSGTLVYLQNKGLLTYTGDVRAVQEGRIITCQQLDVQAGKDRKVETMTCTGQAHLVDPLAGRDLTGDRALYKVKERVIEMYGNPVHMKDKDGNHLQGKHMTYTIAGGRVEVKGDPTAPTPPAAPATGAPAAPATAAPGTTPAKPAAAPPPAKPLGGPVQSSASRVGDTPSGHRLALRGAPEGADREDRALHGSGEATR